MDIFCQIKKNISEQIIDETDNFFLLHDGYPLLEGHLLLIPKKHVDCYLNLNKKLSKEFDLIKSKIIKFLKDNYYEPVIFEHGNAGQTVLHAHLHFLPTKKLISNEVLKFCSEIIKPAIPYLYLEYQNSKQFYSPNSRIKRGLLHSYIYAKILDRPSNGLERAKSLPKWLLSVKSKYLNWKLDQ